MQCTGHPRPVASCAVTTDQRPGAPGWIGRSLRPALRCCDLTRACPVTRRRPIKRTDWRNGSGRTVCMAQGVEGRLDASGLKFGVVVAKFNDLITRPLLRGALASIDRHGGISEADCQVAWVPGSFELPVVAKSMARSSKYDAIICIGAVVRGSTTHYDAVAGAAYNGVLGASMDTGVPVIFGVLTCETMEQAVDRAGGKLGNKGYEAGVTAIEMANLMKELRREGKAQEPWGHPSAAQASL